MSATCSVCEVHAESTFKVEGMDCREEVSLIEKRFKHLRGIEDFSADVIGQRLLVKYDAAKLTASAIAGAVADTGMRAWLEHEEPIVVSDSASRRRWILVWTAAFAFAIALALDTFARTPWIVAAAAVTARRAWNAIRAASLDINVLMLVAASGAVVLGQWSEAAAVTFLFAVAQMLEARTMERARSAVRALMELTPAEALVSDQSGERRISVKHITPGDTAPCGARRPTQRLGCARFRGCGRAASGMVPWGRLVGQEAPAFR